MKRTQNFIRRSFAYGCFALAMCFATACGSASKQTPSQSPTADPSSERAVPGESTAGEFYGPQPGDPVMGPSPPGSPNPVVNPDRIVLVLGPGLVHGYAHVGVLRALRELKVEIHSIYATEMGALAGALYYTQPNPNRIDWALLRFTDKNLQKAPEKFSFRLKSPEGELEAKLKEVFGDRRLESLNGKLHLSLEDAKARETVEASTGDLWRVLRGALAGANGFSAVDLEGRELRASRRSLSEEYRIARQREDYPVVVVSPGSAPNETFRKLVQEQNGTVLHVPMGSISNVDMKQRNQAAFYGKNAVHQAATEILRLVGRKPESRP